MIFKGNPVHSSEVCHQIVEKSEAKGTRSGKGLFGLELALFRNVTLPIFGPEDGQKQNHKLA